MTCRTICKLCPRLIMSQAVTFADGNLLVNLPAGSYQAGQKYCIVIAQTIPTETTISAPVYVTIGTGTELYPLNKRDCAQATACALRTRTKYAACVVTTASGGSFRLLGKPAYAPDNTLAAVDGTAPTAEGGTDA